MLQISGTEGELCRREIAEERKSGNRSSMDTVAGGVTNALGCAESRAPLRSPHLAQLLFDDEQLPLTLLARIGVRVGACVLGVLDDEDVERRGLELSRQLCGEQRVGTLDTCWADVGRMSGRFLGKCWRLWWMLRRDSLATSVVRLLTKVHRGRSSCTCTIEVVVLAIPRVCRNLRSGATV